MEHSDLAAEMPQMEKVPAAERIRQAKKRRAQQLKRYVQWSKAMDRKGHQLKNLAGDDPNRRVRFSQNIVLLEAAARSDIDEVRALLKSGVNPNAANDDGLTALHQCCIDNSEAMCRLLLEFNADVNARDTEQWTPLHAAATCGHIAICRLLVDSGAELLSVNADGNMPYDICEEATTLDYIEGEMARRGITQQQIDDTRLVPEKRMLQELSRVYESSPSKPACRQQFAMLDAQGASLLHVACANGFASVIAYLVDEVRVPLDTKDKDGWAPVHVAACWGQLDAIEALAVRGADLETRTANGETVYDMCEDPALKERLASIKQEAEQKRLTRAPSVKGASRKASMTRGASVRRSSMREKNMLSRKEARQEAQLLPFIASEEGESTAGKHHSETLAPPEHQRQQQQHQHHPAPPSPTSPGAAAAAAADPGDVTLSVPPHHQPMQHPPQQRPVAQPRQTVPRVQQQQQPPLQPQPQPPPNHQQNSSRPILMPPPQNRLLTSSGQPTPPPRMQQQPAPPQPLQQQQQQLHHQPQAAASGGGGAAGSHRMRFSGTAGDTELVVGERQKSKVTCCAVQ